MAVILDPAYAHKGKPVGEVRVKVRLINGVDETLWRVQQLPRERVRIWETEALVDTGAVRTKNLFLRDKRARRHVLLVTTCAKSVNLRAFADQIGADNLSFASAERLARYLGVTPGAVTVLGLSNDTARDVELYVDEEVWRAERLHAHPLVNTATLVLTHDGLARFLAHTGHTPAVVRIA